MKINSKWNKDLILRCESLKVLEEKVGEKLQDTGNRQGQHQNHFSLLENNASNSKIALMKTNACSKETGE